MTTRISTKRGRTIGAALLGVVLALPAASAQAQNAVITGKVTSEFGQPVDQANVYINDLSISVGTNAEGRYTITIPAARVTGQAVNLRVRAIGYQPGLRPIKITAGSQTFDFALKQDINRLNEVVVTGTVGAGTERSKVPFAISRLTNEDLPVPALDPISALQGKISGVRIASSSGKPGAAPEIMLRGPTSINAQGRSQSPLFVVDGVVLNVGSFDELGGLDIESVEVVKGAAGASIYGATAANGVIVIKTKRGATQDGIKLSFRTEYGFESTQQLQLPAAAITARCSSTRPARGSASRGTGGVAPCSRSVNWMSEMMRINSVVTDTTRTAMGIQFGANSISAAGGEFLNVFEANVWPGQRYDPLALLATPQATTLNSLDASGRVGGVRFFASGSYTDDQGAIRGAHGQQSRRGRVNLDYEPRANTTVSISTMYDRSTDGSARRAVRHHRPLKAGHQLPRDGHRSAGSCWSARSERSTGTAAAALQPGQRDQLPCREPIHRRRHGDATSRPTGSRSMATSATTRAPVPTATGFRKAIEAPRSISTRTSVTDRSATRPKKR